MSAYMTSKEYMAQHPILIGGSALIATILVGVGFACATGMVNPTGVKADGTTVIITAPTPVTPVIVPVPVTPVPVTVTTTIPTTPATTNNTSNSSDNSHNSDDHSGQSNKDKDDTTTVTVIGHQPDSHDLSPCCTSSTPTTPAVIDIPGGDLSPCCETSTPVVPVIPPVVTPVTPPTTTVTTPPLCIFLKADQTEINPGDAVKLSWKTEEATSITIDQGVGSVTPVTEGSTTVHPTTDTTYKATVNGIGGVVTCTASITIKTTPPPSNGPACLSLTADKHEINSGDAVTLSWKTRDASSISIDQGVGSVTPVAEGSTVVHPTTDTTYTATVPGASVSTACQVKVVITTTPPGGCTSNCGGSGGHGGGGGGHGGTSGQILPAPQAGYVYLSQIPYTGLDLGPVGTVIYWVFLSLWCVAATYLVLFKFFPFVAAKLHLFGMGVDHVLNGSAASAATVAAASAHAAGVAHLAATHAPVVDIHATTHEPAHTVHTPVAPAAPANSGFSAFAAEGQALTIDDIVKGLSRESGANWQVGSFHQDTAMPHTADAHVEAAPVAPTYAPAPAHQATPVAAPLTADVRDFVASLLNDDRDTVFGTVRHIIREGGDAEAFLSQVVCAIDDAYRARVEGTAVHPEIAEITRGCSTAFLERLVAALTNAVDSSYSVGITGAKLALTRALAIIEG